MAQISFNENDLLNNFERFFRHESTDNIALTKSYDMLNYITDFSNLQSIKFISASLDNLITPSVKEDTTGAGTGPSLSVVAPVTSGTSLPVVASGPVVPVAGTGPVVAPVPGTGPSPLSTESSKINLDSPKLKLLKKIKSELLNSPDMYIVDKYIIIFMEQLIKKPVVNYEDCDKNTIIELCQLLFPICQHESIVSKKDKIIESINKSPIVDKEITDYLNEIKKNKDLTDGTSSLSFHFVWQKTISILKPLFDKFRESTEPLTLRGGNIISLDELKFKIREKIEKIIPKKSLY